MPKQKIPQYLRLAIWHAYERKSGYDGIPISFGNMEIDHIIPERVLYNPKEPDELIKWREKYDLDTNFNIQSIENFCPSTREFNLIKSDNGLYDETDAFKRFIMKAIIRAKRLKPKIEELSKKYKSEFDVRKTKTRINDVNDIKRFIKTSNLSLRTIIESVDIPITYNEITDIEEKKKYDNILEKYRVNGVIFFNYGEYLEIKDCIRYSFNKRLGEETFWISLIDNFIAKNVNNLLKKKLFYEKAYAMFKTEKVWTSIEVKLLEYFKSIKFERNLEVLEQSVNLFNVFYGESQRNRVKTESSNILDIRNMLSNALDSKIKNSKTQLRIIQLKFRKVMLNFAIKPDDVIENNGVVDYEATQTIWVDRIIQEHKKFISIIERPQFFDIGVYYNLFKGISEHIPIIENHKNFEILFEKLTILRDKYVGTNSSIKDSMKRSIRLFEGKEYDRAIRNFQKVKIKAFNPDKIYDCIFAFYYIGLCFERLGLLFASNYYLLTAFYLSNEMDSDYNTKQLTYECGMDKLAENYFKLNHFKEAIHSTIYALMLRSYYSTDIIDFNARNRFNSNINALLNHIIDVYIYEKKYGTEEGFSYIQKILETFGLLDLVNRSIDSLPLDDLNNLTKSIEKNKDKMLVEFKKSRSYSWQQVNVNWIVKWDSEEIKSPLSAEFISYAQIILFCLRDINLSFINEKVVINLSISENYGYNGIQNDYVHIVNVSENRIRNLYPHITKIIEVIFNILKDCAKISKEQFFSGIEPIFKYNYFSNSYLHMWIDSFESMKAD